MFGFLSKKPKNPIILGPESDDTVVVLEYTLHCKNCPNEMKQAIKKLNNKGIVGIRRIQLDEGPPRVTANEGTFSKLMVQGVFDPTVLIDRIKRSLGKTVTILEQRKVGGGASYSSNNGGSGHGSSYSKNEGSKYGSTHSNNEGSEQGSTNGE